MRTIGLTAVLAGVLLVAPRVDAVPGTCTITQLDVAGTFPFFGIGAEGLALPVDIDPSAGRFVMERDAFTARYPSPGLKFQTGFGPFGWLDWDPGPIEGTIDSNGQVVLPNFGQRFWTDFSEAGVPGLAGTMNTTLSTGLQARSAATRAWLFYGQPMNASGVLRLVGTGFINFQLPLQTGTGMTCQLAPVPNLADLPKGLSLVSVRGRVKPGPDASVADDQLTLSAALVTGANSLALLLDGSQDVLLRLKGAAGEPVNLLVPGGSFQVKGKKLLAQDDDGSVIQAISDQPPGQDQPPAPSPTTGGSLVIKKAKKRTILTYKVAGLETAQLSGQVEAAIALGTQTATRQVTFTATKKGPKFR